MRIAALLFLAACGASTPTPTPSNTGAPIDAPVASVPHVCRASFADYPPNAPCPDEAGAYCAFPEGTCHCEGRAYCGGRAPPPELVAELAKPAWQCVAARTDGCPDANPSGSCSTEGQQCYGSDGCCGYAATCINGVWVAGETQCPP